MAGAATRAPGLAEEAASAAAALAKQPNSARWFSIVAMFVAALAFSYLLIIRPHAPPLTAAQYRTALADRDAALRPSTEGSVEALRAEVKALREDIQRYHAQAAQDRAAVEQKIDHQGGRIDRLLELVTRWVQPR